jgi:hypothetical protein
MTDSMSTTRSIDRFTEIASCEMRFPEPVVTLGICAQIEHKRWFQERYSHFVFIIAFVRVFLVAFTVVKLSSV